ncbi:MAG TPA: hypothetical protein VF622_16820 [Segetibacter sp.]|jgi:Ca2+/Na+ antiporter
MEVGETIFIVIALVVAFFAMRYLEKFIVSKTEVIVSFVAYVLLMGMFIYSVIDRLDYLRLGLILLYALVGGYSVYRKYRNYKRQNSSN